MDTENLHIFDAYSKGLLSEFDRLAFENRLELDPALKEEFNEYLHIVNGINAWEHERLKTFMKDKQLRSLYRADNWNAFRRAAVAAAVILIVAIPGYIIFRTTTYPQRLVKEFYIADPGLPVVMGASVNPLLDRAMLDYKDGQYTESLEQLLQLLAVSPDNDTLNYYIGICYFETLKNAEAIDHFKKVGEPGSRYYYMARYNEALALIRDGQKEAAKTCLMIVAGGDSGPFKTKAQELLKKI